MMGGVSEARCRNIRPLRGFATHREANTPSVSECRVRLGLVTFAAVTPYHSVGDDGDETSNCTAGLEIFSHESAPPVLILIFVEVVLRVE